MQGFILHCRHCRHEEEVPPHKCPECGEEMVLRKRQTSMHPGIVLFLLFFVLGPFALGFLWRNDRFTRSAKWALTFVMAVYTGLAVWVVYIFYIRMLDHLESMMNQFQVL